jgi:hypothetical protein
MHSSLETVGKLLVALVSADVTHWLPILGSIMQRLFQFRRGTDGMYEVLSYQAVLEIQDTSGSRAAYRKRQRVRFLQDNVIAYQDQAWGDGHIFAEYRCSPGVAVDRYREGHRYRILISLRQTKNRGDVEDLLIERTILNGFQRATEEWQTEIDHPTKKLSMTLIFPKARLAKQITLIEQNAARSHVLGAEHRQFLPDGREQVTWSTDHPKLHEAYILRWMW